MNDIQLRNHIQKSLKNSLNNHFNIANFIKILLHQKNRSRKTASVENSKPIIHDSYSTEQVFPSGPRQVNYI